MPGFPMPNDPTPPITGGSPDPTTPTTPFGQPAEPQLETPPPPIAAEVAFTSPPVPGQGSSLFANEPPPPPVAGELISPEVSLSPVEPTLSPQPLEPQVTPMEQTVPTMPPTSFAPTPMEASMYQPSESTPPPMEPPTIGGSGPTPASLPSKPSSIPKFAIIALVLVVVVGIAFGAFRLLMGGRSSTTGTPSGTGATPTAQKTPPVQITYWGLWESPQVMRQVLDAFEKDNPDIKVDYQLQSQQDYRERLQTAITKGTAPDVVRMHASWLPMMYTGLQPAPADTLTTTEIQANFYPAAQSAVIINNQVYGVPTTMDGLALFTNQTIFSSVQANIPKTWNDVRAVAKQLTQKDAQGKMIRAGIALGNTTNVDNWPDIVTLMLLQNGVNLLNPQTQYTTEALKFYTLFVNTDQVWDATFPNSIQAFASGKVAMILAPSWRALDIQALNPTLSWKVSPVPQLPGATPVSLVNFWIESVPAGAAHPKQAWRLAKYLASSQAQQLLFTAASAERGFGQAPANKALASTVGTNSVIGPYIQDAQNGQTFYTISATHDGDTGINSRLIKYLEDAVNVFSARTVTDESTVTTMQQGFNQVLSSYNLVQAIAPSTAPTSLSAQ